MHLCALMCCLLGLQCSDHVGFSAAVILKFLRLKLWLLYRTMPEHIYNPITAMGFSAMFTFQLDNTKK